MQIDIYLLTSTTGHPYKLFKHFCANPARSKLFNGRVVNVWSAMSVDTVN